jgi:hypothetical protein
MKMASPLDPQVSMRSGDRFHDARMRAMREDLLARLTGKYADLLPYEAVAHILKAYQQLGQRRLEMIPLNKIVGSVGRYRDFTRSFMPREAISSERWSAIDRAINTQAGVPPIEVYQVGEVYFVVDGNHRVSVARANGLTEIEATVTPIRLDIGLAPGDSLDQAVIKAEGGHFISETELGERCEDLDIIFTRPDGYSVLLDHINVHRYFMGMDRPESPPITFKAAARDWYQYVYQPIHAAIIEHHLMDHFPERTAADLYVWVSGRILALHQLYGKEISPDEAVAAMEGTESDRRSAFSRTMLRFVDHLAELVNDIVGPGGVAPAGAGGIAGDLTASVPPIEEKKDD